MISSHFPEIFLQYFLWNIHELMIYSLYWLCRVSTLSNSTLVHSVLILSNKYQKLKAISLWSVGKLRSILLTYFLSSEAGRPARLTLQLGRTFIRRRTPTEPVSPVIWRKPETIIDRPYKIFKQVYVIPSLNGVNIQGVSVR